MKFSKVLKYASIISAPLIGGRIIGKYAVQNARKDYKKNVKPPLSPPGYVFPIVWPILYLSTGIAHFIVVKNRAYKTVNDIYYSQLGLNYLWSILYFKYKLRGAALIESYILFSSVILTATQFYKVKKSAGLLLLPYVCWTAFATYLTTGNWTLNKDNPRYTEK